VKERQITGEVGRRVRDNPLFGSCAIEVKYCKGETLGRSALKEHQRRALQIAHGAGLYYKISDESYGQKPFDIFCLKGAQAYVVVVFGSMREVWAIPIDNYPSDKESLKLSVARVIGVRV